MSPACARQLATAAGLDVQATYRAKDGTDRYATAVRFADRRVDARRPGIDVTISAPKSVSVLFGLGDRTVAAAVRDAHQAAVVEALGYLESVAGHGLRGHQGDGQRAAHIGTDGWIVAAFEHHTSRAGDPQLHTHLVVPNLLHGIDGKWSAVDTRQVYRHALTSSYLYHSVLRAQLTQRLGVAWTAPTKGVAEIDGVPADLLGTFSTRRRQIVAAMTAAGITGPDAAQAACLAARPAKPNPVPEASLRDRWTASARARAAGHHPARLVAGVLGRRRPPRTPPVDQLAAHLLGPAGLTAQVTCHKAQGATVDVALLYGTAALTREAGYVALSRGRTANHLYVADDTSQTRAGGADDGYLDELAARLSHRRTQTLATRQLPRTRPGAWKSTTATDPALQRAEGISR